MNQEKLTLRQYVFHQGLIWEIHGWMGEQESFSLYRERGNLLVYDVLRKDILTEDEIQQLLKK